MLVHKVNPYLHIKQPTLHVVEQGSFSIESPRDTVALVTLYDNQLNEQQHQEVRKGSIELGIHLGQQHRDDKESLIFLLKIGQAADEKYYHFIPKSVEKLKSFLMKLVRCDLIIVSHTANDSAGNGEELLCFNLFGLWLYQIAFDTRLFKSSNDLSN
ncbi:hypothetical protein [Halalkalibacter hemicellulosilyticus]|uniref:Uncharacterized protein n=1 Tax=Halalkalibacter hemicellulosilyticusJCM 9152 TaxID=1236971 RepID=W4QJN6_9BACI|nr:hypothetical protein [Halalkalibacter hemicellulosilyticus]GAE32127.1 hypothetical protein JCM9152_3646 [Halalkalibacter hemicellulosilyticusJCM 9152]